MKQEFIALLRNKCVFTKCVFPNNQMFIARPTLIYLNPDKLHYYPFMVSLNRCDKSFNTAEDPFGRMCDASKIEDVSLNLFNL